MDKIIELMYQLARCDGYGSIESFTVEGNTYLDFSGTLSWEKFTAFMEQLKKFEHNEITILTNDLDFNEWDNNVDMTFEAVFESKTPKPKPHD